MMDDLVTRLRAALGTEEATAQAAGGAEWSLQEHEGDTVLIYDSRGEPVVYDEGWPTPAQAAHIVAHGPAFVLADIAAKRKLLDLYEAAAEESDDYEHGQHAASLLSAIETLAEAYGITTEEENTGG
jgi:hypothetical protein